MAAAHEISLLAEVDNRRVTRNDKIGKTIIDRSVKAPPTRLMPWTLLKTAPARISVPPTIRHLLKVCVTELAGKTDRNTSIEPKTTSFERYIALLALLMTPPSIHLRIEPSNTHK